MSLFTAAVLALGALSLNLVAMQYATPESHNLPRFRQLMLAASLLYAFAVFGFATASLRQN
jgi:hypothetical protein